MPPSFDLVVLGRKERNAVIACRKNPDRKEEDVVDGRPVNTEWRGEQLSEQALSTPAPPIAAGGVPEANMDMPIESDAASEQAAA